MFYASAQFKYLQTGNYILRFDSTQIEMIPSSSGSGTNVDIKAIGGSLYVRTYYESVYYFNAALAAGNVSQIGTTGLWLLTCPTTITATKGLLIGNSYLEFSNATHNVVKNNNDSYDIYRTSDNKQIVTIYPLRNNSILWHIAPSTITTPFGSSGIKRIIVP